MLTTGRTLFQYNTITMTGRITGLRGITTRTRWTSARKTHESRELLAKVGSS
jgi:hypothetical protein